MDPKEQLCILFEEMMKYSDFKTSLPHLTLPEFLYEKYGLEKPIIPTFKEYLAATATAQFMPGGQMEIREPAPGGIRPVGEIKVEWISDLSNNTTTIDVEPVDCDFKKVIVPEYVNTKPESEPSPSLTESGSN